MEGTIAVLAGDGIGPEILEATQPVIEAVERKFGHRFTLKPGLIGGAAFERHESHFPDVTRDLCTSADAILFGSVGGPLSEAGLPKWKNCEANSILALRKTFNFFANLRPCRVFRGLEECSPLRREILSEGADIVFVRELNGDIYFGEHTLQREVHPMSARDVAEYNESQIEAIAHFAFSTAAVRSGRVTSVDKANVLATSRLWREVVTRVHEQSYVNLRLEHMLVDNCAMQLVRSPAQFDVILTSNLFGDILSDLGALLPGSLGLTPSASLSASNFGLYEPSGGSAPDIANQGIANPIAQILSFALLLRYSFQLEEEALAVESAVQGVIDEGLRTRDITPREGPPSKVVGTRDMGRAIADGI